MRALVLVALLVLPAAAAVAEPLPQPKQPGQTCPSNYYTSGSYCVPQAQARDAVPKVGATCPSGWYVSGQFCVAPERRR